MKNSSLQNPDLQNNVLQKHQTARGQSLIEFALLLPLLLMLALGVVDYARTIHFNNILAAMSREGADLAARTSETPQNIITALNNTAEPLLMNTSGRVYITKIMGRKVVPNCVDAPPTFCATFPQVQEQTRALNGAVILASRVWACPTSFSSSDGSCNHTPTWVNATAVLPVALRDGEVVFAVETLYDYTAIVNYVMTSAPDNYSLSVL